MNKNRLIPILILGFISFFMLVSCQSTNDPSKDEATSDGKIKVVVTFSILADIVKEIGKDFVTIHSMVPVGTDPHEYDPLPEDIKKGTDADLLIYNGLNLEGGENGWFFRFVESVGKDEDQIFKVMDGVEPMYLTSTDGPQKEVNPHAFLDPVVGIKMAENTRDALIQIDPDRKDFYEQNAIQYIEQLEEIDRQYEEKIAEIPEKNRILITSERAFQYMASRYGLREGYIWEIDTEEIGTVEQITALINRIREEEVPALFVETNVDHRPMESVAKETGIEIYGELYSDELGENGTYLEFLIHNLEMIYEGLTQDQNE